MDPLTLADRLAVRARQEAVPPVDVTAAVLARLRQAPAAAPPPSLRLLAWWTSAAAGLAAAAALYTISTWSSLLDPLAALYPSIQLVF